MRKRWRLAALAIGLAPALLAAEPASPLSALDGNWQLIEIGGRAAPDGVTLKVENGSFSGRGGCNRYFGSVKAGDEQNAVQFGAIGATRMSCGDTADGQEMIYLKALAEVARFEVAKSDAQARLTLRYGVSPPRRELVFKRVPD